MLRKLLEGRLVFTPMADGTAVEFRGTGVLDPVLRGIVDGDGLPKASGSRWRSEPVSSTAGASSIPGLRDVALPNGCERRLAAGGVRRPSAGRSAYREGNPDGRPWNRLARKGCTVWPRSAVAGCPVFRAGCLVYRAPQ